MSQKIVATMTIGLTQDSKERLDALCRVQGEGTTEDDIIRGAFRLYEALVLEANAGAKFHIDRGDGNGVQPYEIFAEN